MSWTDERVEQLKQMWIDGLSASQIAGRLGGVTRNAVIGKVHRLGLSGRGAPTRVTRRRPSAPRAPRATTPSAAQAGSRPAAAAPPPEPEELEVISDPSAQANLLELTEQRCKWPIGDPGDENFHFCGQRSAPGLPYCAAHARMAYQPPPARQNRRARQRQFPNRRTG